MILSLCQHSRMFIRSLRRFLCFVVLLGIAWGPVSVHAAAIAMSPTSENVMATMPDMDDAGDMSCCPKDEPSQSNDCEPACPLALLCSSIVHAYQDGRSYWRSTVTTLGSYRVVIQESQLTSTLSEPPARPPKI